MSLGNPQKQWNKKSKSPIVMPKVNEHNHTWVKIMNGHKYCIECCSHEQHDPEKDEFAMIDLSPYFDMDTTFDYEQNLINRIVTIDCTFKFLKKRNPDESIEELVKSLDEHYKQLDNESKYYSLERKIVKKETHK